MPKIPFIHCIYIWFWPTLHIHVVAAYVCHSDLSVPLLVQGTLLLAHYLSPVVQRLLALSHDARTGIDACVLQQPDRAICVQIVPKCCRILNSCSPMMSAQASMPVFCSSQIAQLAYKLFHNAAES